MAIPAQELGIVLAGGARHWLPGSPAYYSRVFVEERGEMAAIVIFIRALLVCWRGTIADIRSCVR